MSSSPQTLFSPARMQRPEVNVSLPPAPAVQNSASFIQRHRRLINAAVVGSVALAGMAVLVGAIIGVSQSSEAPETNNNANNAFEEEFIPRQLVCQVAQNIWDTGACVLGNLSEACIDIQGCLENLTAYGHDQYGYALETVRNICHDAVLKLLNPHTGEILDLTPGEIRLSARGTYQGNYSTSSYHIQNVTSCDSIDENKEMPFFN